MMASDSRGKRETSLGRTAIQELVNWLHDGRELDRLEKLMAEAKANPHKRTYSRSHIRNPDGSVYRRKRR